jgi:hypothetical protein
MKYAHYSFTEHDVARMIKAWLVKHKEIPKNDNECVIAWTQNFLTKERHVHIPEWTHAAMLVTASWPSKKKKDKHEPQKPKRQS